MGNSFGVTKNRRLGAPAVERIRDMKNYDPTKGGALNKRVMDADLACMFSSLLSG